MENERIGKNKEGRGKTGFNRVQLVRTRMISGVFSSFAAHLQSGEEIRRKQGLIPSGLFFLSSFCKLIRITEFVFKHFVRRKRKELITSQLPTKPSGFTPGPTIFCGNFNLLTRCWKYLNDFDYSTGIPTFHNQNFYFVSVHPLIQVPNQLVGAPLGADVTLHCHVEASPKAINYWTRESGRYLVISN